VNVAPDGGQKHRAALGGRLFYEQRIEMGQRFFHRLRRRHQLRQEVRLLFVEIPHADNGRNENLVHDFSRRPAGFQHRVDRRRHLVAVALQNGRGRPLFRRHLGRGGRAGFGGRLFGKMIDEAQRALFPRGQKIARLLHIHELHARGIGDRHREAAVLGHGEEGRVQPRAGRHAERHVGKPQHRPAFERPGAPAHRGERFLRGRGVGCDRHREAVHHDILFGEAELLSLAENRFDKRPAPHGRLGQVAVGQRQQNEHGAVFCGQRQKPCELFPFAGNGIDQHPPRIQPERRLDRFHPRRIDHQRQRTGRGQKADHLPDGLHLVNARLSDVHVQKRRALRLLLLRHLADQAEFALCKLLLQGLFSGGIDSFADHKKRFADIELQKPARRTERRHRHAAGPGRFSFSDRAGQRGDMIRRGAAAAAQKRRARRRQLFGEGGERRRVHVKHGPVALEPGHPGVGLGQERHGRVRPHRGDEIHHLFGAGGAVAADGVCPQALQRDQRGRRRRAAQRVPVRFIRHGNQRKDVRQLLHRDQRGARLLNVDHGFDDDHVTAAVDQAARLFLECRDRFLEGQRTEGFDKQTRGADVARHQGFFAAGFPRQKRELAVHRINVFFHAELSQFETVRAERAGVDDLGAG